MRPPSVSSLAAAVGHHRFVLATVGFFFGLAVLVEGGGSPRAGVATAPPQAILPAGHDEAADNTVPASSSEPMGPPTASGFDVAWAPDIIDSTPPSTSTTTSTTTTTTTTTVPPDEPECDDDVAPEAEKAIEALAALFGVSVPEDDGDDECDTTTSESTTSSAWG